MKRVGRILFCLSAPLLSLTGHAATVTNAADNGPGTLRQAIASAQSGDTIGFSITGTIILTNGELLVTKDLIIQGPGASSLTIQRSTSSGTPDFRIFHLQSGVISISGLTVSNGHTDLGGGIYNETTASLQDSALQGNSATTSGGGVYNVSSLTLTNCTLTGNAVAGGPGAGYGGGVDNDGTVTALNCIVSSNSVTGAGQTNGLGGGIRNSGTLGITNSVVNGNVASDSGGGIFNEGTLALNTSTVGSNLANSGSGTGHGGGIANTFGTVTVDRSTISSNSVGVAGANPGLGGGMANDTGSLVICNSTLSGNIAGGGSVPANPPYGGGIFNGVGSVMMSDSTITANVVNGNTSQDGGGLFNSAGTVESIKNNILAGNLATTDVVNGQQGDILSSGFNLFGATNGVITAAPGDRFNLTATQLILGPLQDNGGPTFTHALLCGSPAINTGDGSGCGPTDQRGFSRIVGGIIDIGAYEYNNAAPTVVCPLPTSTAASGGAALVTLSAQVTDPASNVVTVVWLVDGAVAQTTKEIVNGPSVPTIVPFTSVFAVGVHNIQVQVTDPLLCSATCSTIVYVTSSQHPCDALILGLTNSPPAPVIIKLGNQR
jgi:hypothetical protein